MCKLVKLSQNETFMCILMSYGSFHKILLNVYDVVYYIFEIQNLKNQCTVNLDKVFQHDHTYTVDYQITNLLNLLVNVTFSTH